MGKIIVDQLQRAGQTAFQLPSADTSGGGLVQTDGSGNILVANTLPTGAETTVTDIADTAVLGASTEASKMYNFTTNPVDTLDVSWSDILPSGKTFAGDVAYIKMEGSGISAAGIGYFKVFGKDASGQISTGYFGYTYHGSHYGNANQGASHNSNQGWWQFPQYTTVENTGQTYSGGISFAIEWHPHLEDTYGNHNVHIRSTYKQNNQTYPNVEQLGWMNQGTSVPPASPTHGFTLTNTAAGDIDRGYLRVTLVYK